MNGTFEFIAPEPQSDIQGEPQISCAIQLRSVGIFMIVARDSPAFGDRQILICDIVFGILASIIVMYFSRQREFRADAGAAQLIGSPRPMMAALHRLGGMEAGELPQNVATAGINGRPGWMELFSSHPPIEQRIAALQRGS